MMKGFGVWVLSLLVGTALIFYSFSSSITSSSFPAGMVFSRMDDGVIATRSSRKLKEDGDIKRNTGSVNLEDYHPIDPGPSSKASVKPGPIQHGTPLIPYMPKPSPPGHPKHGGSS